MKKLLWILVMVISFNTLAQTKPVLSNFRVEASNKDRVYFDVSGDISELTIKGFVISDKTISSINTSGNYFKVSKPFTFWDNNTIRLGEITDKNDRQSIIYNFTLQYIKNNIPEPKGNGKTYYVSLNGNDKNSGLSETKAWRTITFAAKNAKAGDVVYIKAGDYGKEKVVIKNSGKAMEPIKFIGYKNTIEDNPKLQRTPSTVFSASTMPYIHSTSKSGSGFSAISKNYIIVRNIQVEGYESTINIAKSSYCIVDNVYVKGGKTGINDFPYYTSVQNRVINSYTANASHNGVYMTGARHLIDNTYASSDAVYDMDYYLVIVGGNVGIGEHIIRNCKVKRYVNDTHPGHGISIKAQGRAMENCLVEGNYIKNVAMAMEVRHHQVRFNVYRSNTVEWDGIEGSGQTYKGIQISGAENNMIERNLFKNVEVGVVFLASFREDPDATAAGKNNIFRNNIWYNNLGEMDAFISMMDDSYKIEDKLSEGNLFINNTISNVKNMWDMDNIVPGPGNKFINCIFNKVVGLHLSTVKDPNFTYEYCDFYSDNSGDWSSKVQKGDGNLLINPKFKNAVKGDFRLRADSPLIDKGKEIKNIKTDFDGNPRSQGKGMDIGAFEYQDSSTSSIKANAGSDQTICQGNSVTLTASGGSTYSWNTGATTQSITVSPNTTNTYTVTVSEGGASDTDSVLVTVNSVTADAGTDKTINEGDSVTLTASGGDTYLWNTGATTPSITVNPKSTKTYSVTAQLNACEDTDEVIVKVNQNNKTVTANAGEDQTICLGDSVTLTASGGSSYSWNTGATTKSITVNPNTTTTYTVTVSDGSVSDADEVIVKVNNITANAGADKTINAGENVTLTASEGDAYLWNTGAKTKSVTVSPQQTKNYSVTVYKGSCEDSDDVLVTVNQNDTSPPPAKADAGEDQTICLNKSIKLTARGGATYLWSTGETSKSINVSPTRTTTYTVTATRGGVTNSDSVIVTVENCSALSDETKKEEFNVYPNPSTGTLHIKTNSEKRFNLNIYSINGSVVYTDIIQTMNNSLKTINLTNLNKGIYIVRLFNSDYNETKKVLLY